MNLPLGKLYFLSVAALGTIAALVVFTVVGRPLVLPLTNPVFWIFMALGLATELVTVPLPNGGRMTASFAVLFATLILLGPRSTVAILVGVTALASLVQRRSWKLAWFNFGQYALAYLAADQILDLGRFQAVDAHGHWPLMLGAAAVYLAVNVLLVNGYIALEKKVPLHRVFWEDDRWELLFSLMQAPVSVLLVLSYQTHAWFGVALVFIPLLGSSVLLVMLLRMREARARLNKSLADEAAANERLDAANRELSLLHDVAQKIVSQIDLQETLRLIARESEAIISCDEVLLYLTDPETGELTLQRSATGSYTGPLGLAPAERGPRPAAASRKTDLTPYERFVKQAAADLRPVRVGDLAHDDPQAPAGEFRSLLAVPILGEDRAAGAIAVLARRQDQFTERDQAVMFTLASYATFAIRNAQLYRATQQLAITDGLTAVYNRRYFQRQLESELRRAPRYAYPTSLILLDVDHFKAFNDGNGHLLGDQVLRSVAQILKDSVRETDVVARYGGEEFAVILPETGADVALVVAERIRSKIKAHPFMGKGQKPARVTASLGIASHVSSEITADALIDRADKALYMAKNAGRDRICSWTQDDAEPLDRTAQAPAPSSRRQPTRIKSAIDITAWKTYLSEAADPLTASLAEQLAAGGAGSDEDRERWQALIEQALASLGEDLARSREDLARLLAPSLDEISRHPLYANVRAEISRGIAGGLTLTASENLVLSLCNALGDHVRQAPFSPQEQVVVLSAIERLTHYLQLAVSSTWHEFYQQTNAHLVVLGQLEARLQEVYDLDELLSEAVSEACEALGSDVGVLLLADDRALAGQPGELRVRSSCGLTDEEIRRWGIPTSEGLSGEAFRTMQPRHTADALYDPRVHRASYEPLYERTGVRSGLSVPLVHQGAAIGVLEIFSRERRAFSSPEIRLAQSTAGHIAAAIERVRLEEVRQERYFEALSTLVEAIEAKDGYARGHHQSLVRLVDRLAQQLGLSDSQAESLHQAGRFHDLGKVAVPDDVLLKPGPLDDGERQAMQVHPEMGARLLSPIASLGDAIGAILHHHERWNGTGYPAGLVGDEIPLLARILAVAEAWEGMTTAKAYRAAISAEAALAEMRASGHFDPGVLDALEAVVKIESHA